MKNCKYFHECGSEADVGFSGMCSSCWMDHGLFPDEKLEKPQPAPEPPVKLTKAMLRIFMSNSEKWGLRREFKTGRNGWSENVAKALERRGWARFLSRATWDARWEITDAGAAAWARHQAAEAKHG